MKTVELSSSLHKVQMQFEAYRSEVKHADFSFDSFFRGVTNSSYKLVPKLSRYFNRTDINAFEVNQFPEIEHRVLTTFLEKIEKYHKNDIIVIPQNGNDFSRKLYSLGQMQHLEIPTRLMDWTFKELIALYFAVSSEMNDHIDGAVWGLVVSTDLRKNIDSDSTLDPLTEQNSYFLNFVSQRFLYDNFEVKLAEERIGAQGGRLLFQNFYNSLIPIEQNHAYQELLTKFIIPGKAKKLLRESLERIEEVDELKINTKSVMSNRDEIIEQIGKEIELEVLGCQ